MPQEEILLSRKSASSGEKKEKLQKTSDIFMQKHEFSCSG